jgi:LytR cell envelope-related transcriptional attenuator
MDLIERIGPFLGLAAFLGFSVLVFLLFQQAREVRRLREWAGRAPERAQEAADASLAAAEARGEGVPGAAERVRTRLGAGLTDAWGAFKEWWREVDRRLPIDGRIILGAIAALALAGGVLAGGSDLFGTEDDGRRERRAGGSGRPEVAVLNATQTQGVQGVQGLAGRVADRVVKPAGYDVRAEADATEGVDQTVVMFEEGHESDGEELAARIQSELGTTPVAQMSQSIRERARGADLALVIGLDDSRF